jgi:hypothetical protein
MYNTPMLSVTQLISIVEVPFSAHDYERFGIKALQSQGFETGIWDCSPFLSPNKNSSPSPGQKPFPGYRLFHSELDVISAIAALDVHAVVLIYIGYGEIHRRIYQTLSARGLHYGIQLMNSTPPLTPKGGLLYRIGRALLQPHRLIHYITAKAAPGLSLIRPPDFILVGGTNYSRAQYPISRETRRVWAHSFDYETFLELRSEVSTGVPGQIVYLDQFIPFHPDHAAEGRRPWGDPMGYYAALNKTFDSVERSLGGEVVIAAHPRSDYETRPKLFGARRVVKGDSARLVRDCKLVLAHHSAAVNFANLFEKPVAFLDSFRNPLFADLVLVPKTAAEFGKLPVDMDHPESVDWKGEMRIDGEAYARYRERSIKSAGSPDRSAWLIFGDYIRARQSGVNLLPRDE